MAEIFPPPCLKPLAALKKADSPMLVNRDFFGSQTLGARREQQDCYAFGIIDGNEQEAHKLLLIIADGMGGHNGGREASNAAVNGFVETFFSSLENFENGQEIGEPIEKALLKLALVAANTSVEKMISGNPSKLADAGTTLLATVIDRGFLHWISVGDSLLLLWREEKLIRLNADHSMRSVFAERVAAGEMLAAEAANHYERNMLFSAISGDEIPEIDGPSEPFALQSGDIIIAASDGVLTLEDEEISDILKAQATAPVSEMVRIMLKNVERKCRAKQDNTTISIIRV